MDSEAFALFVECTIWYQLGACQRLNEEVKLVLGSLSWRTHTCGELRAADEGKAVTLCGWLQHKRFDFLVTLRDSHGVTQAVLPEDKVTRGKLSHRLSSAHLESVVKVKGHVQKRPDKMNNTKMPTGDVEVVVEDFEILNNCMETLPIQPHDHMSVSEATRMLFRYLDLRSSRMQRNLRLRSEVALKAREYLWKEHNFVEVETPTLFRRTPGGAKEFIVPTHQAGHFYSLPQSPQQFKQLLMVGAIDRYFQIARCFRDEGSRPDRQPEFTQIDIEMSFVDKESIYQLIEGLMRYVWPRELPSISDSFPRITYSDAMNQYGTDKPDTRFDMKLVDVTSILKDCGLASFSSSSPDFCIKAIRCPLGARHFSRPRLDALQTKCRNLHGYNFLPVHIKEDSWKSPLVKHLTETVKSSLTEHLEAGPGDMLLICAGKRHKVNSSLGFLRLQCADILEDQGVPLRDSDSFQFLWVEDFPLFLPNEETLPEGTVLESAHHPFTAPVSGEEELIYTDPLKVRGQHYDLVLNGVEVAGGSIRIHDANLQRHIIENILKEDSSELTHLLQALDSGCPPHGGIAIGFDRFIALLCGESTIREVIAFPKTTEGNDLMSGSPSPVPSEDLARYHVKVQGAEK
ncbi:aspartate--tRNA ligase, mitochondrial-like isoform X2 [Apostichopus japonicus]|uniref:aspartate--tRNA ligase, mitochondrial-like isoform X2 n=1 Tax=Stichopus japonicus TaxID=307972 RepID=UPI003AB1BD00